MGGPLGPSPSGMEWLLFPLYFLAKVAFVVGLLSAMRGAFSRMRVDQMVSFAMRYLVPISLAQVALTLIWGAP